MGGRDPEVPEGAADPAGAEGVVSVPARVYERDGTWAERAQFLTRELPVTLHLNGREVVTLLCAGQHLEELAAGFFYAEGFLRDPAELEGIRVDAAAGRVEVTTRSEPHVASQLWSKRTVTSGCGKGSAFKRRGAAGAGVSREAAGG